MINQATHHLSVNSEKFDVNYVDDIIYDTKNIQMDNIRSSVAVITVDISGCDTYTQLVKHIPSLWHFYPGYDTYFGALNPGYGTYT